LNGTSPAATARLTVAIITKNMTVVKESLFTCHDNLTDLDYRLRGKNQKSPFLTQLSKPPQFQQSQNA
jgi:hypothetical protein